MCLTFDSVLCAVLIPDIQELSIIMQTKHNPANVRLIPDTQKISRMNEDTLNSFRDQQKFKVSSTRLLCHSKRVHQLLTNTSVLFCSVLGT